MNFLRNQGVRDANTNLNIHNNDCRIKMEQLENKKRHANNNLAGATWEQSISAEMQAHATLCDMRQRELLAHRDRLEQELRELQAENPYSRTTPTAHRGGFFMRIPVSRIYGSSQKLQDKITIVSLFL